MSTATASKSDSQTTKGNVGAITQILGSIFDAQFPRKPACRDLQRGQGGRETGR